MASFEPLDELRATSHLPTAFRLIEECDKVQDYAKRAVFVYHALAIAAHKGMECGIRVDDPNWPVVAIKLPQGDVAWHCEAYKTPFDGHSTEEKYARIKMYCESQK